MKEKSFDDYLAEYLTDDERILSGEDSFEKYRKIFEQENNRSSADSEEKKAEDTYDVYEDEEEQEMPEAEEEPAEEELEREEGNDGYVSDRGSVSPTFINFILLAGAIMLCYLRGFTGVYSLDSVVVIAVSMIVFFPLSVIIHETGHLIFGLISGYRFASFRIGKHMFVMNGDRLTYKQYAIKGSSGQCLMIPPDCNTETYDFPYRLYNLGGVIANTVAGILTLVLFFFMKDPVFALGVICASYVSFYFALVNGLPRTIAGISNDGANALYLDEDFLTKKAFYVQLKINGELTRGVRYRDMNPDWFHINLEDKSGNPLLSALAPMRVNYLVDKRDFKEAEKFIHEALAKLDQLLSVHRSEMLCELLYMYLIDGREKFLIDSVLDARLKRYIATTNRYYIARCRQLYTYELLYNHSEENAKRELDLFKRLAPRYPYETEVEGEIELMRLARKKFDAIMNDEEEE